jgi:hypothetical protein
MAASASAQDVTTLPITDDQQLYEFIAEFINNGPANLQFGYLAKRRRAGKRLQQHDNEK